MKKLFLLLTLVGAITLSYAQDYHFIDASTGEILEDSICIPYNGEVTLKFNAPDIGNFEWIELGDIHIDTTYGDTAKISSIGYAKGAVRIKTTGCSTIKMLYIFKEFYPESDWLINGPECITEGDTVVFSIDPILTKNLDANIGFDKYYWNIYTEDKPSCVADIIYNAGDGSSVTFKVGEITEQDTLEVNLGYCNKNDKNKSIKLPLLKKAPIPDVISDTCISYGEQEVILYNNPVSGVYYKWTLPSDYEEIELTQTYAKFKVNNDVSAQIIVIATYDPDGNNDGCADTPAYIQINRGFNKNASIRDNTNRTCVNVGDDVKFYFEAGTPIGAVYNWSAPEGWDTITEVQNIHNSSIIFRPTSSSSLMNIISVSLSPCSDTILKDTVYVKPSKIPVENIVYETNKEKNCLELNETIKLYVDNWNNIKPHGDSIVWVGPNEGWTITPGLTPDTAYIYVANNTSNAAISVYQVGKNYCDGDSTQVKFHYAPITPQNIIKPTECIASNMPDELIFNVSPRSGEKYHWNCINGTIIGFNGTSDSSSVLVRTDGVAGSYVILEVNAFNDSCGVSSSIKDSIKIPEEQYSMSYSELIEGTDFDYGEFSINGRLTNTNANFEWYFLDNGIPVSNVLDDTGDKYVYYADNQSLYTYGDISTSNRYTVVCVITINSTGCQYRKTYGAPLPSNYVIPVSSNINAIKRRTQRTTFDAFPNPTNGILNLKSSDKTKFSYYIYSIDGHLILKQLEASSDSYSIDTSSLSQGIYEVVYVQHHRKHSGKFIKE